MKPIRFKVGNVVVFGKGVTPYRVAAVISTGRTTTYDLIGETKRYQGVPHRKLNPVSRNP